MRRAGGFQLASTDASARPAERRYLILRGLLLLVTILLAIAILIGLVRDPYVKLPMQNCRGRADRPSMEAKLRPTNGSEEKVLRCYVLATVLIFLCVAFLR